MRQENESTNPPTNQQNSRHIHSVTELNHKVKNVLENRLPTVWVEGEISNLSVPSSGHWYLTLKDDGAQIRSAMFRGRNRNVNFIPKNGTQVVVYGNLSLYAPRGDYQLIIESMEEAGEGALRRAFEQLKAGLEKEGLFDDSYKKPIPEMPKQIGVVTSGTGAAFRDIVHVLKRRFPSIPILLFPVPVQGNEAAPAIKQAIEKANTLKNCDVLIVGRGGGSLEDLWAFNEEIVARAIFQSEIPIVSAVGHQTDFTIADFVADLRAPTPSAAAEVVSPDQTEWLQTINSYEQYFLSRIQQIIADLKQQVLHLSKRLRNPNKELEEYAQKLDQLEIRLLKSIQYKLSVSKEKTQSLNTRFNNQNPLGHYSLQHKQIASHSSRLENALKRQIENKKLKFSSLAQRLDSISPLQTLQRGFSITKNQQGEIVSSCDQVSENDAINVQIKDGTLQGVIREIKKDQ